MIICTNVNNHNGSNLLQTVSTFSKIVSFVPETAGIILDFLKQSSSIFDCLLAIDPSKSIDKVREL